MLERLSRDYFIV